MRPLETDSRDKPAARGRHRSRRRAVAIAAIGIILALGIAWGLVRQSSPLAPRGTPRSANLLVNGSFEQPVGSLLTIGHSMSWWQRFQIWYRINSEINRTSISRRQRPVYVPFPPPPPELAGWRVLKGTVDVVGHSYWQQALGQGNQSIDLIGTPGAATIEQTFPTEPGREYLFSGWLSHNPVIDPALVRRANVYLNNALFVQLVHGDPKTTRRNMRWRQFSYRFRATACRTTLKLQDVTAASGTSASYMAVQLCGTVLDGLSITPVTSSRVGG
jgi:hypothetical protein